MNANEISLPEFNSSRREFQTGLKFLRMLSYIIYINISGPRGGGNIVGFGHGNVPVFRDTFF